MSKEESGLNKEFIYTWSFVSREQRWKEFKKNVHLGIAGLVIFGCGALYILVAIKLSYSPM